LNWQTGESQLNFDLASINFAGPPQVAQVPHFWLLAFWRFGFRGHVSDSVFLFCFLSILYIIFCFKFKKYMVINKNEKQTELM